MTHKTRKTFFAHLRILAPLLLSSLASMAGAQAFVSQIDPAWKDVQLGNSDKTIGQAGCMMCCETMALRTYGYSITPLQNNAWLTANGGLPDGYLVHTVAAKIDGPSKFIFYKTDSLSSPAYLKAQIDSGMRIIARSSRYASHYGFVVGYRNGGKNWGDFFYADPMDKTYVQRFMNDGWIGAGAATTIYWWQYSA